MAEFRLGTYAKRVQAWIIAHRVLVAVVAALLFAAVVWPTMFRYDRVGYTIVRINRFTGVAAVLTGEGWSRMITPPRKPGLFDDLTNDLK